MPEEARREGEEGLEPLVGLADARAGGMSVLGLDSCCDALHTLSSARFATEGLKRDLCDEVEFRQARLTAQGKKLRASIDI